MAAVPPAQSDDVVVESKAVSVRHDIIPYITDRCSKRDVGVSVATDILLELIRVVAWGFNVNIVTFYLHYK